MKCEVINSINKRSNKEIVEKSTFMKNLPAGLYRIIPKIFAFLFIWDKN